jgi:hypothetical protein
MAVDAGAAVLEPHETAAAAEDLLVAEAEVPEPLLSANFCAKGNHGPCQGQVYNLAGVNASVEACECHCHKGKTVRRQRNQW